MVKLHLGCGTRRLPGFTHVDTRSEVHPDVVADASNLSQFGDNTVDLVYACHVLEHFGRGETLPVLREWNRVLVPNGTLRLSVPDFSEIARQYVENGLSIWRLRGFLMGRQNYPSNTHHTVFDREFLGWMLTESGFYDIVEWSPGAVWPEGYHDYSYARINGESWSLNLEAKKIIP